MLSKLLKEYCGIKKELRLDHVELAASTCAPSQRSRVGVQFQSEGHFMWIHARSNERSKINFNYNFVDKKNKIKRASIQYTRDVSQYVFNFM